MISATKSAALLMLPLLGVLAGLALTRPLTSGAGTAREGAAPAAQSQQPQTGVLAQLGLDETQREQIARLRAREQARVEFLQRAFDATERELRRAELAYPFDAKRVNDLVADQAELAAHLRGTESRVVAEIAAVLTPDQRQRFVSLRAKDEAVPSQAPDRPARRPRPPAKGIAAWSG